MIDGVKSYRIFLKTDEDVKKFKEFIIRNNGDKNILKPGFLIANKL